MKKNLMLLLAAFPFAVNAQQQNFTINGTLKNVKNPAIAYVYYQINGRMLKDSAAVVNDKFTIKGSVAAPMKSYVCITDNGKTSRDVASPDQIGVYLENGTISITSADNLANAKIGGTPLNKDQQELYILMAPFKKEEAVLNAAFKGAEGNTAEVDKIKEKYTSLLGKKEKAQIDFIKKHTSSLVSLNLIRQTFDPAKDLEKAKTLVNLLSPELKATPLAKRYIGTMEKAREVNVGGMAPEFSMKNTKGIDVSLASYKGKYVLLDFWASWCVPCRMENPNVIKAYNRYKDKNFTIVGISLDGGTNGKEKWMEAIAKDGLSWEQLSDLEGGNNAVARMYKVNEIPANFLIDPTGKIIAKNLRGAALEAELETLFAKAK